MMRTNSWLGLTLACTLVLLGCPTQTEEPDAGIEVIDSGVDAGPVDSGVDSGIPDAGFKCVAGNDDSCSAIGTGLRCDDATRECVAARGCLTAGPTQFDPGQCAPSDFADSTDYCYELGNVGCRCVQEANDAGTVGVCKRRHTLCQPCDNDGQCGAGGSFDPPGKCVQIGGNPAEKFCIQAPPASNRCEDYGGYIAGSTAGQVGFCVPQSNSCADPGCLNDDGCPSPKICNNVPGQRGVCVDGCRWNFGNGTNGELDQPGCPNGETCWVDAKNLTQDAGRRYGVGRCKAECQTDTDCTDSASNPHGGANLRCRTEVTTGGASAKRCRPDGCMSDFDPVCPYVLNPINPYIGYCDLYSFQCKTDCRLSGTDPITGESIIVPETNQNRDCRSGFKCAANGPVNECILKECSENGMHRSCPMPGQFCCGADIDLDGIVDPCPATGVDPRTKCYDAPRPPFCTICDPADGGHELCQSLADTEPKAGVSNLPSFCFAPGGQPDPMNPISTCFFSTHNSLQVVYDAGVHNIRAPEMGCPRSWAPITIDTYCDTHADCQTAENDAGICLPDPRQVQMDGTVLKTCMCNNGGGPDICPNPTDGGLGSVCFAANKQPKGADSDAGLFLKCVYSVVCQPERAFTDAGTTFNGCGLGG